ncbi:MAG: hypothetical protein ACE144_08485 [Thermodesulfobacteriota bacterium]
MKPCRWSVILLSGFLLLSCAKARTYSLSLRYQPGRDFPSLQQKIGSPLGIVPLKDERPETSYVGILKPLHGVSSYFKSDPVPLDQAIAESLTEVLSRQGVKTVPLPSWDGEPSSLKNFDTDSVLMIEVRKFWIEEKDTPFRMDIKTSIHFVIHLGVKKEGRVFSKNVTVEKEMGVFRLKIEEVEQTVNGILTEVFDGFFSNPY